MCTTARRGKLRTTPKIHGRVDRWYADVAQVPCAVTRRNVQAPTQRYRQVSEVPANSLALLERFEGRPRGPRELVTESQVPMDEITNRLHAGPTGVCRTKLAPGELG